MVRTTLAWGVRNKTVGGGRGAAGARRVVGRLPPSVAQPDAFDFCATEQSCACHNPLAAGLREGVSYLRVGWGSHRVRARSPTNESRRT